MRHRTPGRSCSCGFTLIELLVVISIISLLVAILLPVLSKARSAALGIKCASNIRQVNFGMYQYQIDSKDWVLGYRVTKPNPAMEDIYWWTMLLNRHYIQNDDANGQVMYTTVTASVIKDSTPPLRCIEDSQPAARYSAQNVRRLYAMLSSDYIYTQSNRSRFLVSYSMNHNIGDESSMKRLDQASRAPSDIIYFTCGEKLKRFDTIVEWQTFNMFAHNGSTNTAYLDGHVAARTPESMTTDQAFAF